MNNIPTPARLQAIGLNPAMQRSIAQALNDDANRTQGEGLRPLEPWRVVEVQRAQLQLHDGAGVQTARVLSAVQHTLHDADDALAVGDWVLAAPDPHGDLWVHQRIKPTNQIARRSHDGRDRIARLVIVSNVDTALLTMGLDHDFNLRRLERYLMLAKLASVEPLVVLTKADLLRDAGGVQQRLDAVRAMLPPLAQVVAVNGLDASATRATLLPWLQPCRTLVLLGSSGAGKSTLTNALLGKAAQDTGPTREADGRGRHTTTSRTLHALTGGACIIDTPGLRTLRLDADEGALRSAFDDVSRLAVQCRFRNCRHEAEPGCAVRDGLAAERLRSYQKLGREAARDAMTLLERQRQHALWRQRSRQARAGAKAKARG